VTPDPDPHVLKAFNTADALAGKDYPYVFGGGHPGFGPSGIGPSGAPLVGYDCSGWVSAILHAGEILEHPTGALGTHELARWGEPGQGEFLTLWVVNNVVIEHCFLEFKLAEHTDKRFSMAARTGTICGWFPEMSTAGYTPRRRKAFTDEVIHASDN